MSNAPEVEWVPAKRHQIAAQFALVGRIGFYAQLALLVIPIVMIGYVLLASRADRGIDLALYISIASLALMIFTTFWFFRYAKMGDRIKDPARSPPPSTVIGTLWVGLWAGFLGIFFSILLLLTASWRMLIVLLTNPQSGMLIAPTLGTNTTYSLSAIDAVSLVLVVIGLAAELVVLGLTLWLLFRVTVTWASSAAPATGATIAA